ncbi:protein of unknown function [Hyphomicrobium sp. MC1]|nr:protein of unknown function [Hyphomicrobium sp. MC1]
MSFALGDRTGLTHAGLYGKKIGKRAAFATHPAAWSAQREQSVIIRNKVSYEPLQGFLLLHPGT